jgi:DNA repair protein RadC
MAECSNKSLSYKALRIEDIPKGLQPREMLRKIGPRNVGDDTLLAVILRIGVHGANAIETARRLLVSFGSLDRLSRATYGEIVAKKIPGIGQTKALQIIAALELGRRCSYIELMKGKEGGDKYIRTSGDLYDILLPQMYGSMQERFFVVLLGPRNKMLSNPIEVAKGQRDEVAFQANLIFEHPLKEGAKAIVVAHNHPSGDPTPSDGDIEITQKLVEAGRLLNIPVLDHLIVGTPTAEHSGFFSIAASGLVDF